jgi:hypothetical protein
MKATKHNFAAEARFAKLLCGDLPEPALEALQVLNRRYRISVVNGDVKYLNGAWYVTHSGLLSLAERRHCVGIHVRPVMISSDPATSRWVFRAVVHKSEACKGFVGYGDADPFNVSPLVRGAEMRVAETRAVNRALRKAYGIGLCSVEEIGSTAARSEPPPKHAPKSANDGNGTSSTLRDRLTRLIRRHQLDPALVKLYAADFCGVHELRKATRELVEDFVNELASQAAADRTALLCKLNSYAPKQEGVA